MDIILDTSPDSLIEHPEKQNKDNVLVCEEKDVSWSVQSGTDSEDDMFDVVPAFLQSVQNVVNQELPSTPDFTTASQSFADSNTDSIEANDPGEPELRSRFSLEDLLEDKERSMGEDQRRLEKVHSECKKDIEEGGFITILDRVNEEGTEELAIPEEKNEILKQLNVVKTEICEDRPGQHVFHSNMYCCLFGDTLHPTHCGFTVGGGKLLEKHLQSLQQADVERLVTGGLIPIGFEKIQCQEELLRWLFFLMSVHPVYSIRHGCRKVLMEVLHTQQLRGKHKWSPTVADVLSVFVNYGATLDSLLPNISIQDGVQIELFHQPSYTAPVPAPDQRGFAIDNVLEIIAYSLKENSRSKFNSHELTQLLTSLLTASLDKRLENYCAFDPFHICVQNVVHQYTETDWNCKKISLCRLISKISTHHHDKRVLLELLPLNSRGNYLQRRTSFVMLEDICCVSERQTDEQLDRLKIQDLHQFVGLMKEMIYADPYKASSVTSLLSMAVGYNNTRLTVTEREELRDLMDEVKRIGAEIRDNVRMLDRTRVKDMLYRMANRWSLDLHATRGKQCSLLEFVKPRSRQLIQVEAVLSNEESGDSDWDSDSEGEGDKTPCKMPRLEPFYFSPSIRNPESAGDNSTEAEDVCMEKSGAMKDLSDSFSLRESDENERDLKLSEPQCNETNVPDTDANMSISSDCDHIVTSGTMTKTGPCDSEYMETALTDIESHMDCVDDNELPEL